MKDKTGFTLIELLGVMVLLGVLALVTVPIVDRAIKEGKDKLYQQQIENIELALRDWATDHHVDLPENDGDKITLTVWQLKQDGRLDIELFNPKTKKCIPNDMELTITKTTGGYLYDALEDTGTETDSCGIDKDQPILILNGSVTEYVEIFTTYVDKGAIARNSKGDDLTNKVVVTIRGANKVDTNKISVYTVNYFVTDNGRSASVNRKVVVRDIIPPVLTVPKDITIDIKTASFDVMEGVSASDNSKEKVNITAQHNITLGVVGSYTITYVATDTFGNMTTLSRIVTVSKSKEYKDSILNGADPEIGAGMIPVIIESNGTVKKADISKSWYNYSNKEWANVVTVIESSRNTYMNAAPETVIAEKDILTYLVWIPRYRYQLWNVSSNVSGPRQIAITFENKNTAKSNGSTNGTYSTHPAFTFGTEELNGFWVGKFETGYRQSEDMTNTSGWTTVGAEVNATDASKVVIKPLVNSWRSITISNMFFSVQRMKNAGNIFGLTTVSDSHMMKNSEWGAVAYLSHSLYGKGSQIRINNNSNKITGCAASTEDAAANVACENGWNSATGYLGSTTGNITGIYDMSGGAWEYVMGYTTGASTQYGSSGFTTSNFPTSKYLDTYSATSNTQYTDGKLGDATKEIGPFTNYRGSWYNDYTYFAHSGAPWFARGGYWHNDSGAGAFSFSHNNGQSTEYLSFRVVVLGE